VTTNLFADPADMDSMVGPIEHAREAAAAPLPRRAGRSVKEINPGGGVASHRQLERSI
jgi:hypothetical protein